VSRSRRFRGSACLLCDASESLQLHHVDGDHDNDRSGNHATLCQTCHAAVHKLIGVSTIEELAGLALQARHQFPDHFLGGIAVANLTGSVIKLNARAAKPGADASTKSECLELYFAGGKARRQDAEAVSWTVARSVVSTVTPIVAQGHSSLSLSANVVLYHALQAALFYALSETRHLGPGAPIRLLTSSELVVNQIDGSWKCRAPGLRPLFARAKELMEHLALHGHRVVVSYRPKREVDRHVKEWHADRQGRSPGAT
jgi:ribonuclease HI